LTRDLSLSSAIRAFVGVTENGFEIFTLSQKPRRHPPIGVSPPPSLILR